MQYWDGDRDKALRISRFIADLQDGHSDRFDFMFCPRFDSTLDPYTIRYVSRKFNVWTHISTRKEATSKRDVEERQGCLVFGK
jgi:hypothetical protein